MSARDPNAAWDGVYRTAKPADYVAGLYMVHQLDADHLLKTARGLTHWEAEFLQTVRYQGRPLSDLQRFWLDRLEREYSRRAA